MSNDTLSVALDVLVESLYDHYYTTYRCRHRMNNSLHSNDVIQLFFYIGCIIYTVQSYFCKLETIIISFVSHVITQIIERNVIVMWKYDYSFKYRMPSSCKYYFYMCDQK